MSKASATRSNKDGMNNIVKFKSAAERLQRSLSGVLNKDPRNRVIKGGHFAVIAFEQEQPKRVVLPLSILKYPVFLSLLEKAAEEYGFEHQGALTVPCSVMELEWILADLRRNLVDTQVL